MKLIKNNYKFRCEIGGCCNWADYVLVMDRTGIHSKIFICEDCAKKMLDAVKKVLQDKEEQILVSNEKSDDDKSLDKEEKQCSEKREVRNRWTSKLTKKS